MAKINILPAKVYNRIAAGEVVDRPYSVVKELVENAIDAGATEIEIYVEKGGKQLIRVVDNGCGIEREDLQSAFLPHATSKIATAEDLENVLTLGFRGEAVASIASVSKMTITSQVEGQKCYSLSCSGGEMGQIQPAAGEKGTDVRVEMLFFNAPVRLNFLKSDKAEETDITTFVSRFILNRSEIAFTYYVNGKKVLQSFGGGMEEALVCVYGAAVREQCIEIDAEKHGIRLRGYIGNQNFSKPNKSYQSVFLNGRYVLNATLSAAISGAYGSYLMKRQYPFYVLHVTMPTEIVDVNVHPNKADVRFADNGMIYGCVYSIISAILDGKSKALEYIVPEKQPQDAPKITATADYADRFADLATGFPMGLATESKTERGAKEEKKTLSQSILERAEETPRADKDEKKYAKDAVFGGETFTYEDAQREIELSAPKFTEQKTAEKRVLDTGIAGIPHENGMIPMDVIDRLDEPTPAFMTKDEVESRKRIFAQNGEPPKELLKCFPGTKYKPEKVLYLEDEATENKDYFAENKKYLELLEQKAEQNRIEVSSCRYVGKVFNTYLLYERADDMYLIDQHAAHERLIFDKLKKRIQNREPIWQEMLVPYELHVNEFEANFICEHLEELRAIGIDIRVKDSTHFLIHAVPIDLPHINLSNFFNNILGDLHEYRAIKLEDIIKDKMASAACKAAIKGGKDLSREEIDELFMQMDGDLGLKCPHGRPVVVKLTKKQIEKMFKRIV